MRFEVTADVDAPVEQVWRWWTDYGGAGHEEMVRHGFGARNRRKVVEARDDRVVLDESIPMPFVGGLHVSRHEVLLDREARRIREVAVDGPPFEATWTFETNATGGTRIRREVVAKNGPGKLTPVAVAKPIAQRDLDHHVREFLAERPG